jgi:hypothetical protein
MNFYIFFQFCLPLTDNSLKPSQFFLGGSLMFISLNLESIGLSLERNYSKLVTATIVVCGPYLTSCKLDSSSVKAIATAKSLKTGMFMPLANTDNLANGSASRIKNPATLAAKLNVNLSSSDTYRTSTTSEGENVLLVERKGMMPIPVFSIGANGVKYQWSFLAYKGKAGGVINGQVYIRHGISEVPSPFVSQDGRKSNIYIMRQIYGKDGTLEPLLVSWLNHIATSSGDALFRVGNVIFDSKTGSPIVGFRPVGHQVWEMVGLYANGEINPGTVFWSKDLQEFYSLSPVLRKIVKWKKQDNDSMDRIGQVAAGSVTIPKIIEDTVSFREKQGFGVAGKVIPLQGPATTELGSGVIPLYTTDDMYMASRSKQNQSGTNTAAGFSLTGVSDDEFFEGETMQQLKQAGAVLANLSDLGLTDSFEDAPYSGSGPRTGSTVSIRNNNNGTSFPKVRIIANEPHLVSRSGINSWWTGKSDYVGYKMTGEVLDSNGRGTGQFIEQTVNNNAGVYDQRLRSSSEMLRDSQRSLATNDDTMRALNTRIHENMSVARQQGDMADRLEQESYSRLRALPGKAISSATVAGVTQQYKIGEGATATVPIWFAQGAVKEAGSQVINRGIGAATNGYAGIESFDPESVGWAGLASVTGKASVDGLGFPKTATGAAGKKFMEDLASKPLVETGKATIGSRPYQTENIYLGVADTAVDATFQGLGTAAGGPIGRAVGAAGAEVAKVGNAQVGSLIVSGRQLSTLSTVNSDLTTAANTSSNTRTSNQVIQYINSSSGY